MQNIFAVRRGKSVLDKLDGTAKLDGATRLPSLEASIASSAKKNNHFNQRNRSINMSRQE
jgi:hypothetical protein